MKKFLKVGLFLLFSSFLCKKVIANELNLEDLLIKREIKSVIKDEEITYLMNNYNFLSDEKITKINKKINNIVLNVYGDEKLNKIKKDFDLLIKEEIFFKNINLDYQYAIPKFIFKNVGFENDSSEARNLYDLKNNCSVVLKFDVDDSGRIFESSELGYKTKKQISESSDYEIKNTLKETLFHELSHCLLKEKKFLPIISNNFKYEYKNLSYSLIKKIINIRDNIEKYGFNSLNVFDYVVFSIYNETYADVMSSFVSIKGKENFNDAKKQLINLLGFRINGRATHKDFFGILNALNVINSEFVFDDKNKELLAREIATLSILQNIKEVFYDFTKIDDEKYVSLYLSDSIYIEKKKIKIKVSKSYYDINKDVENLKNFGFFSVNKNLVIDFLKEIKDDNINIYNNFELVNEKMSIFLNENNKGFFDFKNYNKKNDFFVKKELKKNFF